MRRARVMEATGSALTNKYSGGVRAQAALRGTAGRRRDRRAGDRSTARRSSRRPAASTRASFHVNVQPYSGSPANLAVYLAFCSPGDTVMGLALPAGGHLTHGHTVSITGKFFKSVQYTVRKSDHRIDFDQVRDLALEHRPKLLWCGTTAYPRQLDFAAFRSIADEVGAGPRRRRGPHRGSHLRRRASVAVRLGGRDHVDDAQDVSRPARWNDLLQEGSTPRPSTRRSSPGCRAARTIT